MRKTSFDAPGMDCAAEENLVRMKLRDVASVQALDFDLSRRSVTGLGAIVFTVVSRGAVRTLDLAS